MLSYGAEVDALVSLTSLPGLIYAFNEAFELPVFNRIKIASPPCILQRAICMRKLLKS